MRSTAPIGEERECFWKDMDRIMDRVKNGYILCVLGDLNGQFGDKVRAGITGALRYPGENERGLCVANTYFEQKNLHKYTRVAKVQDGVEVKNMIDLVLVKKDMLRFVQDVKAVRGKGRGILDHYVVLCKVRFVDMD